MVKLFFCSGFAFVIAFMARMRSEPAPNAIDRQAAADLYQYRLLNSADCSADFGGPFDDNLSIPLLDGWGNHMMNITTRSDSAFLYFNQGMNMFYGFHFIEARASFKKAQNFDSTSAMTFLAEALTYGPSINNPAYKLRPYVVTLIEKAKQLSNGCADFEKALIDAQILRYNTDTTGGFAKANEVYAETMKNVWEQFSTNSDVGALYADALLQLHPWNLYDNVGNPRPWTSFIEGEFGKLMKRFPDHPGLNHYYIHCVEASNTAQRGLASARKLQSLTPGLSHMLHMSSHIYIRTGSYEEGVKVNEKAIAAFQKYKEIYPDVQRYLGIYYMHNLAMGLANALFLPNYESAIKFARLRRTLVTDTHSLADSLSINDQHNYCAPYLAWIRFGKWDSILAESPIPSHLIYANLIQQFARGMALARKHQPSGALKELSAMIPLMEYPGLLEHSTGDNAPAVIMKVAMAILSGVIAAEQGNHEQAIKIFEQAVQQEDAMDYNEPKDWLFPARQYLGEAFLSAKLFAKAEQTFKQDLKLNPRNIWSLTGLCNSLSWQHKTRELKQIVKLRNELMRNNDVEIYHAVF